MYINKADQILYNEARRINTKIEQKKKEIIRLEAEYKQVMDKLNNNNKD